MHDANEIVKLVRRRFIHLDAPRSRAKSKKIQATWKGGGSRLGYDSELAGKYDNAVGDAKTNGFRDSTYTIAVNSRIGYCAGEMR